MQSMTGFGHSERVARSIKIGIEIKSVNHRYLETMIRMPRDYARFEDGLKRIAQQAVKRGRLDMFVTVERAPGEGKRVRVDWDLLEGYRSAAEQIRDRLGVAGDLTIERLLGLPDVLSVESDDSFEDDELEALFAECVREALDRLVAMRRQEGRHLKQELNARLESFQALRDQVSRIAPQALSDMHAKLRARIKELLDDPQLFDEHRFAMEAATLAERSDIREELTRLGSHQNQFAQLLEADEPIGRKLDFLIQEMNREVNTIGSKSSHAELTACVVDMKAELEKMREQVQNIQ